MQSPISSQGSQSRSKPVIFAASSSHESHMAEVSHVQFVAASSQDFARGLLGWVSFNIDGNLRIDGVGVRRTLDNRLALSFPARRDGSGRQHPFVRPLDDATRREIEAQVFQSLGIEIQKADDGG